MPGVLVCQSPGDAQFRKGGYGHSTGEDTVRYGDLDVLLEVDHVPAGVNGVLD